MSSLELTPATTLYPAPAIATALERISDQGLWLLLSLDQYGWRAEYDAIRVILDAPAPTGSRYADHAPLYAIGHLFALTDKLWRLIYGMTAHRAGREFLNEEDGYLAKGYKFHKKLERLQLIDENEWRTLLSIPSADEIRTHLETAGATDDDVQVRQNFAIELPGLLVANMRELNQWVAQEQTIAGPKDETDSLRAIDGQYRHGAPALYHDCSPTDADWVAVDERTAADHHGDTIGVVMGPPDASGAALINHVKYDAEMTEGLKGASATLAGLVVRLVRAQLLYLAPGLVSDKLASVADYDL